MDNDPSHTIIKLEQALAKAHLDLDLDIIDDLLHNSYLILQPDGTLENKEELLASYKTGLRKWDTARVDQMTVTSFGDMCRVIGRWSASGTNKGQPFDYQAKFISIWIKEKKAWKNISYHSVELN